MRATRSSRSCARADSARRSTARASRSAAAGRRARRPARASAGPSSAFGRGPARGPPPGARARRDARADGLAGLGARAPHQLLAVEPRHLDVEVDAVGHRAGEPRPVGLGPPGRADAAADRIAVEAARARVARADQQRPGREARAGHRPGDVDPALLERLAQRVERRGGEGADLVEEEDAVVGEADLARARDPARLRPGPPPRWCGGARGRGGARPAGSRGRAGRRPSGCA